MIIDELSDKDLAAWDTYVENSPCGLPQHLSSWRDVLSDIYGYETRYLLAKEHEKVVGVLPLFIVDSRLVGRSATTMPGGLCADDIETAKELVAYGHQIALQGKIQKLLILDTRQDWPGGLHTTTHHEYRIVDTSKDSNEIWVKLHRETRRQVRIARKNGLTVQINRNGTHLDEFHYVLSHFVHKAGTPVFGMKFLEKVVKAFPDRHSIAMVYKDKQPLGAYFQLMMGDTVYGIWGATMQEYLNLRAAYIAYWEILSDTADNGYHFWDMGRNPVNSNTSKFKGQWGGVAKPIYQQVVINGNESQDNNIVNRVYTDTKFQIFMKVWSKLPYSFVQFLGPRLRRHVPFA